MLLLDLFIHIILLVNKINLQHLYTPVRQFWKHLRLTAKPSAYISSKPVMSHTKVFQQLRLLRQWFSS